MLRKSPALIGLALSLLFSSGCWDVEEIDRRATVVALGVDEERGGKVIVTVQIPVYDGLSPAPESRAEEKPFNTISATADSAFAAVPELQSKTYRGLFYGQLKTVVISAGLAHHGVKGVVDFLNRHPEIPPQATMVLTNNRARDILNSTLSSRAVPGIAILSQMTSPAKGDREFTLKEWQFVRAIGADRMGAYLPIIAYDSREKAFDLKGMGVFSRDRLVGELTPDETRMFGLMTGKTRNGYLTVTSEGGSKVSFRTVHSKSAVRLMKNRIAFLVDVKAWGLLVEETDAKLELDRKEVGSIEAAAQRYLSGKMLRLVKRLQNLRSDVVGFGELVRAGQPETWKRVNWRETYPTVPVRVRVRFNVERMGSYR